jgi:hypothetical protein
MKYYGYLLIGFILILGIRCDKKAESRKEDSYDELIINLALAHPGSKSQACYTGTKEECDLLKRDILANRKIIKSENFPLILTLHGWTTYGGDFPKAIVHVSNGEGFEYAFPFFDEYYIRSEKQRTTYQPQTTLGNHINYIIQQMEWGEEKNRKNINTLITFLADSLLEMKEYPTQDTSAFRNLLKEDLKEADLYSSGCAEKLQANVNEIVQSASDPNVRFFKCREGVFGLWRIETFFEKEKLKISASFENAACYRVVLL